MDLTTLMVWIITGVIAGWLSNVVMKRSTRYGLLIDIIVGAISACIFGFMLTLLGVGAILTGLSLPGILTSFMGAIIVLLITRFIR